MSWYTTASTPLTIKLYLLEPSLNTHPDVKDDNGVKPLFYGSLKSDLPCRLYLTQYSLSLGQYNAAPTQLHPLANMSFAMLPVH